MKTKILVITPKFPFPKTGACEQDRGYGIEDLIRFGYDVHVISKTSAEKLGRGAEESARLAIPITVIPYTKPGSRKGIGRMLWRLVRPWTWDGAAYEYYDPAIHAAVADELETFKPDLVWFDYTYLWPLYSMVRKQSVPIITRSINFEPVHFLQEDGMSFGNMVKFLPKLMSEWITVRMSDLVLSITHKELVTYKRMGARVQNLALRGLPYVLAQSRPVSANDPLHVFFFGSTYNVHHNRHALEFLLADIIPRVNAKAPGAFVFHILGAKIPADLESLCTGNARYEGYVADLDAFLKGMDIAVIPSLMGAGMQQKIFEPLARGIPTVASSRGIAGYPFIPGQDYMAAKTADEFAAAIISLSDASKRRALSEHALGISQKIFSKESLDSIVRESVASVVGA